MKKPNEELRTSLKEQAALLFNLFAFYCAANTADGYIYEKDAKTATWLFGKFCADVLADKDKLKSCVKTLKEVEEWQR